MLPLSVVFLMPYAEATFCALAVGRSSRWARAPPARGGALRRGGTVRPTAVALALAVVVAALARRPAAGRVAVLVAPAGVVAYLGWVAWRTGSPTGWVDRQSAGWHTAVDGGASTGSWLRTIAAGGPSAVDVAILAGAAACVVTAVVLARRGRLPAAAYVAGVLALTFGDLGVWNSKYRLLLPGLVVGCALAGPLLARAADAGARRRPRRGRGRRLLLQRLPAHELSLRALAAPWPTLCRKGRDAGR